MKLILLSALLIITAFAAPPRKRSVNEYRNLWTNSPFTTKPPVEIKQAQNLEWSLGGIMNHSDGNYTITLINKRDRNDRRRVNTNGQNMRSNEQELKILKVEKAQGYNYKDSRVQLSQNGVSGWVTYDDQVIASSPRQQQRATGIRGSNTQRVSSNNVRSTNNNNAIRSGGNTSNNNLRSNSTQRPTTNQDQGNNAAPAPPPIRRPVIKRVTAPTSYNNSSSSGTSNVVQSSNAGTSNVRNTVITTPNVNTTNSSNLTGSNNFNQRASNTGGTPNIPVVNLNPVTGGANTSSNNSTQATNNTVSTTTSTTSDPVSNAPQTDFDNTPQTEFDDTPQTEFDDTPQTGFDDTPQPVTNDDTTVDDVNGGRVLKRPPTRRTN